MSFRCRQRLINACGTFSGNAMNSVQLPLGEVWLQGAQGITWRHPGTTIHHLEPQDFNRGFVLLLPGFLLHCFTWCWHTLETPFYTVPSIIFLGHCSQRWTLGVRSIWGERKFTYGLHTAIIAVAALHESLPQLVLCGDPPDTTHLIITFPTSPGFHRYFTALRDSLI